MMFGPPEARWVLVGWGGEAGTSSGAQEVCLCGDQPALGGGPWTPSCYNRVAVWRGSAAVACICRCHVHNEPCTGRWHWPPARDAGRVAASSLHACAPQCVFPCPRHMHAPYTPNYWQQLPLRKGSLVVRQAAGNIKPNVVCPLSCHDVSSSGCGVGVATNWA